MEYIYIIINNEYFMNDLVTRRKLTLVNSLRTSNEVEAEEEKRSFGTT